MQSYEGQNALGSSLGQGAEIRQSPSLRGLIPRLEEAHKIADRLLELAGNIGGHEPEPNGDRPREVANGIVAELHEHFSALTNKLAKVARKLDIAHG